MAEQFEVLVIGGGGAGYTAASTAARLDKRVAMAERGKLGGTCLHVGCVPSKALLRAAHVAETVRHAAEFGIEVDGWRRQYPRVVGRVRDIVQGFSGAGPRASLARQEITLLEGAVRFLGPHAVDCAGQRYEAERFVIASGSSPLVPALPGLHDVGYLTSNEALWLESLPASVTIVGGSIIGCEFASLWAAFGVEVTIVARGLMPQEDPEVGTALLAAFEARGIRLVRGRVVGLARAAGQRALQVVCADGTETTVMAEAVLMATGRQAQFHDLQLDAAGVRTWERGIAVDATMRTSASHIWAAGDVTGRHMYTHAGDDAAAVAGWNAATGKPERGMDWRVVPRPVYAIPETASIGLLESEARAQGLAVDVARVAYQDDDEIVHGRRLGKADRATDEPFNPGPQVDVLAFDLLCMGFANRVLLRIKVSLIGPPPIRVKPRDPKRLEQRFELQKDGILPPPKDIRQHSPTGVIDGMPQPPRLRFLPDITPHFIEF
jgi:pyruvate/2-oxoglutarate dehydrogenase complex dihydrolipoamide dehydrogenase (E3) component